MSNELRCEECGHVRLNAEQARTCCTMQGTPCPTCIMLTSTLKPGDEVSNALRPQQRGHIDRMDGSDAAYVHWNDGSEQLCLLTDLEFTYDITADPRD